MTPEDRKFLNDHIIVATVAGPSTTWEARRRAVQEIKNAAMEIVKQANAAKTNLSDDVTWENFLMYTLHDASEITKVALKAQEALHGEPM